MKTLKVKIYCNRENDDVYAVFPTIKENNDSFAGYARMGGHMMVHCDYITDSTQIKRSDIADFPYLDDTSEATVRVLSDKSLLTHRVISLMKELIRIYTYGNHDNVLLNFIGLSDITKIMYEHADDMKLTK